MCTHWLTQKQATNYWQENGYQDRVLQKNISTWVKNEECIQGEVAHGGAKAATCCDALELKLLKMVHQTKISFNIMH